MRSIKPGRGASLQGVIGSLFAVVFGIVWMVSSAKSGAPTPFVLLGLVFVVIAGSNVVISLMNKTGANRFSLYNNIIEGEEAPNPLEDVLSKKEKAAESKEEEKRTGETVFCPYCGAKAEKDYAFCRSCGKKL